MCQILVFVAQLGKIAFVKRILLVALRNSIEFQQTSLSHEDSLYLEQVVTMLAYGLQRNMACPLLEGVAIDAKAVVTRHRLEISILPRTASLLDALLDGYRLLLQALSLQGSHPRMDGQARQTGNDTVTRWIGIGT